MNAFSCFRCLGFMTRGFILFTLLFMLSVSAAFAAPVDADGQRVSITLESETPVTPGRTLTLAVKTDILDGWHTYWLNAGDSGTPMQITLDMPDGFEQSAAHWPTPEVIPYDPLVNYGYHGMPVILQDVIVPVDVTAGDVTIKARFDVLVCDDICIPESHEADITIPVSSETAPAPEFAEYRAALPMALDWDADMVTQNGVFTLRITAPQGTQWNGFEQARFFPLEWGLIRYEADQNVVINDNILTMTMAAANRKAADIGKTGFVVKGQNSAYALMARAGDDVPALGVADQGGGVLNTSEQGASPTLPALPVLILFAFLGGLILNLMPCVFPVLSIKALSIASHGANKQAGLLYTAGAVLSFIALGLFMLGLRAGGQQIGWGFQLQSPPVVMGLGWLFFTIGLSLAGFFEIGRGLSNIGNKMTQGHGILAQFMTGVLAVIVATPCTAPFMAASIGASLVLPPLQVVLIFAGLGLGLAFPILLITLIPAAGRILPRPGAWMERFKQFLAFPMWISAIWLVWVLARQAGADSLIPALGGMVLIAFAVWLRKIWFWLVALLGLVALIGLPMAVESRPSAVENQGLEMESFTPAVYEAALSDDRPLFVEMTADWCITCKVNARVAIQRAETISVFNDLNIRYLQGDWTNRGEAITAYLSRYGRAGVPLYVYYAKNGTEPVILPQILTPGIIQDALRNSSN